MFERKNKRSIYHEDDVTLFVLGKWFQGFLTSFQSKIIEESEQKNIYR